MTDKSHVSSQSTGKLTLHPKKCIPKISRQFPEEFYSGEQQCLSTLNRTAAFSQIPHQLQQKQSPARIPIEQKEALEFTFFADPQEITFPVISKNPPHPNKASLPNSAPTGIKNRKPTLHYYSNLSNPTRNHVKCSNEGNNNQQQQIPNLKFDSYYTSKNLILSKKSSFKENLNPNCQSSSEDNQSSKPNQKLQLTLRPPNDYQMTFCQSPNNTYNQLTQLSENNTHTNPNRFSKRTLSTTSDNSLLTRFKVPLKESNLSLETEFSSQIESLVSKSQQQQSINPLRFSKQRQSIHKLKLGQDLLISIQNSINQEKEEEEFIPTSSRFSTLQNERTYIHKLPSIKDSTAKVIRFPQSQDNLLNNCNQANFNYPAKDDFSTQLAQGALQSLMPKRTFNQQQQEQPGEPNWFFGKLVRPLVQSSLETRSKQEINLLSERNIQSQQQLNQAIIPSQPPQKTLLQKPLKSDLESTLQKDVFSLNSKHIKCL